MTPVHRISFFALAATFALSVGPAEATETEQHAHHGASGTRVGEVNFPISCSAAAQKSFDQAVWTLHSFWYEEATKAFIAITEQEPIARWATGALR